MIISALAIGLLAFGGYGDLRYRRIPNALCLAIALLGVARMTLVGDPLAAGYTVGAAAVIFIAAFLLFAGGVIGGGDAKLVAATVLLVGYGNLMELLVIMSICGAALGVFALLRARVGPWWEQFQTGLTLVGARFAATSHTPVKVGWWARRISAAGEVASGRLMVPYGVAIASAGIVMLILKTNVTW